MHQLRIVFTCMCAYLPRTDDVLVVIPDGRPKPPGEGGHHGHSGHGVEVPPHVAAIQFDAADLSPRSELQPDLLFQRAGTRREQGILFLTGHDITLDPAPSGAPAIRDGRGEGPAPRTAAELGDFSWVADISKLDTASGVMDPRCVAPGDSAERRVVARMSLQGGTLATSILGFDKDEITPIVFNFVEVDKAPVHPTYKQALAAAVAYDLAVRTEEVTLILKPFKGKAKRLVFSFAGVPMGNVLQVLIKNMPLDSLLEVTHAIDPEHKIDVDAHFAMYYALSENPERLWIPYSTTARPLGPICPNAQFVARPQMERDAHERKVDHLPDTPR
jgi:hypothetical protein